MSPGPDAALGVKFLPPCTKCNALCSRRMNVSGCPVRKRTTVTLLQRRAIWLFTVLDFPRSMGDSHSTFRIQLSSRGPRFRHLNTATHWGLFRCRRFKSFKKAVIPREKTVKVSYAKWRYSDGQTLWGT